MACQAAEALSPSLVVLGVRGRRQSQLVSHRTGGTRPHHRSSRESPTLLNLARSVYLQSSNLCVKF